VGWGENSTAVQAKPISIEQLPTAPRNPIAVSGLENVTLSWDPPAYSNASAINGYMVSYGTSPDSLPNHIMGDQLLLVLDSLTKGEAYYFEVAAQNSQGWGPNSTVVSATPFGVPSVPLGLHAIAGNGITLNWTKPAYAGPGTITYHLSRNGSLIWNGTANVYLDKAVVRNVTYSYYVAASNSVGWSPNSTVISVASQGRPTAPLGLEADAGLGFIDLNWTAPNFTGPGTITYHLFRNGTLFWTGAATSYHDPSPIKGVRYSYKVAAENAIGWGTNSSEILVTAIGLPDSPAGLNALEGDGIVTLNWTAPDYVGPGAITYHLFRNASLIWNGSVREYTDTNLVNSVEYTYQVAAENSLGWGPNSTAVRATPKSSVLPGVPRDFQAIAGIAFVELSWNPPLADDSPPIIGYKIFRINNSVMTLLATVTSGTSYKDAAVSNGQGYYYQVCAFNSVGDGISTEILSATPKAPPAPPFEFGPDAILLIGVGVIGIIVLIDVAFIMRKRRR